MNAAAQGRFHSTKYWEVWVRTFPFISLLCLALFLEMLVKFARLISLCVFVLFCFSIKSEEGQAVAGHAVQDSAESLPSVTSSTAISCPISEDPNGHFWSHLQSQGPVFWEPAPSQSFLRHRVALVLAGPIPYSPLHHPARVFEAPRAVPMLLGLFTLVLPPH